MEVNELIEDTIRASITDFFRGKEVKVEHVLDLIFPKERRIRSLIGGLETSLGTRLWEPLAKAFAAKNGFTVCNEKTFNESVPVIPEKVRHFIDDFYARKEADPSLKISDFYSELLIYIEKEKIQVTERRKAPKGEGVDIWLIKDGIEYFIDIKTTQINAGSGPKFTRNHLNWCAYRALDNCLNDVVCWVAFPFNPHKDKDFWVKEKGKASPLIPKVEAVVADEFWNVLLGQADSTALIFSVFKKLGDEGFGDQFEDIFSNK